jgi:hypothetical protein
LRVTGSQAGSLSLVGPQRDFVHRGRDKKKQCEEKGNQYGKIHVYSHDPPGKFTPDQIRQFAAAAQQDPGVKGYRSFANLAEGKAVCVMEAANKDTVAAWFNKMGMPYDSITKVELEGDRGNVQPA